MVLKVYILGLKSYQKIYSTIIHKEFKCYCHKLLQTEVWRLFIKSENSKRASWH